MEHLDTVVKGGHIVVPRFGVVQADIGLSGEKIAAIATDIPASSAARVVDATSCMVFPGAVDSHLHVGIYRPLGEDATSESTAAASAGSPPWPAIFAQAPTILTRVEPSVKSFLNFSIFPVTRTSRITAIIWPS